MRIASWNIENLTRWLDDPVRFVAQVAAMGAPDILCLQEIRLRPRDVEEIARARMLLPDYACELSLCDDPRNVTFRGGRAYGVATYVRRDCGETTSVAPDWDREGRVLVTALPRHRLAIINLYAVNGTAKPYRDPDTGNAAGDRHAHKRRFQDRLLALAEDMRRHAGVVVIGDWNVSRSELDVTPRLRTETPHALARAHLNERYAQAGWIDAFRQRNPKARAYTWFGRTRSGQIDAARVDYAVVAAELWPRVEDATILDDARLRPGSDHAPILLQLASPMT